MATLKVVRARVKCVLIYSNIERQPFVRYHEFKLQTFFQNEQCCVATNQQQLSRLPTTVSTLKPATDEAEMARARMHHKVVGNFGSEADVRNL